MKSTHKDLGRAIQDCEDLISEIDHWSQYSDEDPFWMQDASANKAHADLIKKAGNMLLQSACLDGEPPVLFLNKMAADIMIELCDPKEGMLLRDLKSGDVVVKEGKIFVSLLKRISDGEDVPRREWKIVLESSSKIHDGIMSMHKEKGVKFDSVVRKEPPAGYVGFIPDQNTITYASVVSISAIRYFSQEAAGSHSKTRMLIALWTAISCCGSLQQKYRKQLGTKMLNRIISVCDKFLQENADDNR